MYGEPRKGTEAYKVKQLADARKKQAQEKGLDKLITDVYFEKLKGLADHLEHHENWKKYKHLEILNLEEEDVSENNYKSKLSFDYRGIDYTLLRSSRNTPSYGDDYYYYLDLYRDSKKVFGLMVKEYSDEYSTTYSPGLVTAYANDEWVTDFIEIQKHYTMASKAAEIAYAEDADKTRKLKEEFGISEEEISRTPDSFNGNNSVQETEHFTKKWWFWVLVVIGIIILL